VGSGECEVESGEKDVKKEIHAKKFTVKLSVILA
jgi:hypothetical protein